MGRSHPAPACRKGEGLDKVLPKGTYEESTRVFACALMQNCLLDKVGGGWKREGLCCGTPAYRKWVFAASLTAGLQR